MQSGKRVFQKAATVSQLTVSSSWRFMLACLAGLANRRVLCRARTDGPSTPCLHNCALKDPGGRTRAFITSEKGQRATVCEYTAAREI